MKLYESLSIENRTRFKKLAILLHPDTSKYKNSADLMRRLLMSRSDDKKFEAFYVEIVKKMMEQKKLKDEVKQETIKNEKPARFKTDEEWKKWLKMHETIRAKRAQEQERVRKEQRG
jgi:hypothetical protein